MKEELLKGLTEEQIAKVKACKSQEELLALAKTEGVELTDEQLAVITGGCSAVSDVLSFINVFDCPKCGHNGIKKDGRECTCKKCGHKWIENY